jgi:hypothetical protein
MQGCATQARPLSQDLLLLGPKNSKVLLFPYREICTHSNLPRGLLFVPGRSARSHYLVSSGLNPPTLPFKSGDTRSGDTGIAPSTCDRGLGLMLALLLQSRDLATSQPCRLNHRIFTLLVHESPRCRSHLYALPRIRRISAPQRFTTRRPHESRSSTLRDSASFVPPVFHSRSAMAHTNIQLSRYRYLATSRYPCPNSRTFSCEVPRHDP